MTAETDLLPCRFCGGKPRVRIPESTDGYEIHVTCRCGARLFGDKRHFASECDAIAAWNRRTNLAELLEDHARLIGCLTQAKHNAEEFERKWHIAGDERAAEKARADELQREVGELKGWWADERVAAIHLSVQAELADSRAAELQREVEGLRSEATMLRRLLDATRKDKETVFAHWSATATRAGQLVEALRDARECGNDGDWQSARRIIDAALDQETTNE